MKYYNKNDIENLAIGVYSFITLERGAGRIKSKHISNELKSRYGNTRKKGRKNGRKKD